MTPFQRSTLACICAILMASLAAGCSGFKSPVSVAGSPTKLAPDLAANRAPPSWRDVDVLLLGEQHDAVEHQARQRDVVQALIEQNRLAALALEMAEDGAITVALTRDADETAVQKALRWNDKSWPWRQYGPAVMAAVRAGVPVIGANLPRANMALAMQDVSLDAQLSPDALQTLQQLIRTGHCNQLPEAQIAPMTRVQIARDRSMGHRVAESVLPGKIVVLIAGGAHVDKQVGVPQYAPLTVRMQSVLLSTDGAEAPHTDRYDTVWSTPAIAPLASPRNRCSDINASAL